MTRSGASSIAAALLLGLVACSSPTPTRGPNGNIRAVAAAAPSPGPSPSPTPALPDVSADTIFKSPPRAGGAVQYAAALGIDSARVVALTVTGDVIPARAVNAQMARRSDFAWPFRQMQPYLAAADLRLIDLEAPLVAGCPLDEHGFKFCGDPRFVDGLAYSGVSVASLANNHLTNYGPTGTTSTVKLLTDHGIQPAGLGFIARLTAKGVRFAFLAFNGVGVPVNRSEMKREIDLARPTADVVVVEFHWGREYVLTPMSTGDVIAPDDPREIGHLAVDDGADLVIGNHPHAVQGVEMYHGRLITYAHGNFVFDQMWVPDPGQEDPRNGVVGTYYFVDGVLRAVLYAPIRIYDSGQPRPLFTVGPTGTLDPTPEGQAVLDRMRLSSAMIAARA